MRKQKSFYKNKNAGSYLVVIIISVLVLFAVIATAVLLTNDSMQEENCEFGNWSQGVTLEFEDGTTSDLGSILSLIYDGKKVVGVYYKLYGSATGTYDTVDIDLSKAVLTWIFINQETAYSSCVWQDSAGAGNYKEQFVITTIPVDNSRHNLLNIYHTSDALTHYLGDAEYIMKIALNGEIKYRVDAVTWNSVSLPSPILMDVEKTMDGSIDVELEQDVTEETETDEHWEWEFTADGWNEVTFTQEQISCCSSSSPVDVLSSIDSYWTMCFEDETWDNYWYNQDKPDMNGGTLQEITPGVLYWVDVTQDCTLQIDKC